MLLQFPKPQQRCGQRSKKQRACSSMQAELHSCRRHPQI
jgi:hypothetical protein